MEEKEKKKIINETNDTIDKVSKTLDTDGNNAKEYVTTLDDSDLKILKELKGIIDMIKNPFGKFVIGIIIVSSLLNICYVIGTFIGQLLGKM